MYTQVVTHGLAKVHITLTKKTYKLIRLTQALEIGHKL